MLLERRDFSSFLDQAFAVVSRSFVFACPNTGECVALFLMQTFYPPVLAIEKHSWSLYRSTKFGEGLVAQRAIGFTEFSRCSGESRRL